MLWPFPSLQAQQSLTPRAYPHPPGLFPFTVIPDPEPQSPGIRSSAYNSLTVLTDFHLFVVGALVVPLIPIMTERNGFTTFLGVSTLHAKSLLPVAPVVSHVTIHSFVLCFETISSESRPSWAILASCQTGSLMRGYFSSSPSGLPAA